MFTSMGYVLVTLSIFPVRTHEDMGQTALLSSLWTAMNITAIQSTRQFCAGLTLGQQRQPARGASFGRKDEITTRFLHFLLWSTSVKRRLTEYRIALNTAATTGLRSNVRRLW